MTQQHERLKQAREKFFVDATEAADAMGVKASTYHHHENGTRKLRSSVAAKYARRFKVNFEWLMLGTGERDKADNLLQDINAMPPEDRDLVADYVEMLKNRRERKTA